MWPAVLYIRSYSICLGISVANSAHVCVCVCERERERKRVGGVCFACTAVSGVAVHIGDRFIR